MTVVFFKKKPFTGLFPGKIAATVFGLKIEFKGETLGLTLWQRSKNIAGHLNFEI